MASTIETFVGWSYGSERFSECGLHLNRARLMLLLILVPVIFLFFNVESILIALKQDAKIAKIACDYVVWTLPGTLCFVQFDCSKRLLQTIKEAQISTYTQFVTSLMHIGWCLLFIYYLEWEVWGAACALNTTYILTFLI